MRRTYNKQSGEFAFSSSGRTMMHCRMLESHCINLGTAVYFWVGQSLYNILLECKVGEIYLLLKQRKIVDHIKKKLDYLCLYLFLSYDQA